jgi:hypothetical protein
MSLAGDVVRDVEPRRVLASHEARTSWRADGAGGVGLRKLHSLAGEAVDVRSFVKKAPHAPEVGPSQVVDQDEDDVGPLGPRLRRGGGVAAAQECEDREDSHAVPPEASSDSPVP